MARENPPGRQSPHGPRPRKKRKNRRAGGGPGERDPYREGPAAGGGPERHRDRPRGPRGPGGGTVWLWGLHAVAAALANPDRKGVRLLVTPDAWEILEKTYFSQQNQSLDPEFLSRDTIEQYLPRGAVSQGVAFAAAPLQPLSLEDCLPSGAGPALVVLLDQVTDPQNVGAILRSAAAFGANALIVPRHHAPDLTGSVAKAASGAAEIVPLVQVANLVQAMETLKKAGFWIVGLDAGGDRPIEALAFAPRTALVLGAEGGGLRRLTRERCDHLAWIPVIRPGTLPKSRGTGGVASLNVSAAAAVALYAATISRQQSGHGAAVAGPFDPD